MHFLCTPIPTSSSHHRRYSTCSLVDGTILGPFKTSFTRSRFIPDTRIFIFPMLTYRKTCLKWPLSKRPKIGFQYQLSLNAGQKYCRMLHGEHSALLLPSLSYLLSIKDLYFVIFEWQLKTSFT